MQFLASSCCISLVPSCCCCGPSAWCAPAWSARWRGPAARAALARREARTAQISRRRRRAMAMHAAEFHRGGHAGGRVCRQRHASVLPVGLALLLGADLGSALVVRVLSFDLSWLVPVLILVGGALFLKFEAAASSKEPAASCSASPSSCLSLQHDRRGDRAAARRARCCPL